MFWAGSNDPVSDSLLIGRLRMVFLTASAGDPDGESN